MGTVLFLTLNPIPRTVPAYGLEIVVEEGSYRMRGTEDGI